MAILGIDVSATHTTVFDGKNIYSYETKFIESLSHILPPNVKRVCIGAAGPITKSGVQLTHAHLTISKNELPPNALLVNDFALFAYALNTNMEVKPLTKNKKQIGDSIIIGAGTGLGKAWAQYDQVKKTYSPKSTEGGQLSFSYPNARIMSAILAKHSRPTFEQILCGDGIQFLAKLFDKRISEAAKTQAEPSEYILKHSAKVREIYARSYAIFIRNCLYELPANIFIAGGIAQKNQWIFSSKPFLHELANTTRPITNNIPIFLICEYKASVQGAYWAAKHLT